MLGKTNFPKSHGRFARQKRTFGCNAITVARATTDQVNRGNNKPIRTRDSQSYAGDHRNGAATGGPLMFGAAGYIDGAGP